MHPPELPRAACFNAITIHALSPLNLHAGCLSMTNVEDAVHLAKGLLRRVHNGIPQLTES